MPKRPHIQHCVLAVVVGLLALFPLIYSGSGWTADNNAADPLATPTPTPIPTPSEIDPRIRFAYTTYFHDESGPAIVTVGHYPWHFIPQTAYFSTSDGTAVGGSSCGPGIDYISVVSYPVVLDYYTTYRNIPVQICPDDISEPNETVNLTITGEVEPPTSAVLTIGAGYRISGRVRTAGGRGIWNAQLRLYSPTALDKYTYTRGSFGWYTFEGLELDQNYYVYVVSAPRHTFTSYSRSVHLDRDYTDIDFTADP